MPKVAAIRSAADLEGVRSARLSSMRGQIISYMPANLIPAIVSVVTVVVFTRVLTKAEFGAYSLGLSLVLFSQGSVYYAIQLAVMRLFPAAIRDESEPAFLRTLWDCAAAVTAPVIVVFAGILLVFPFDHATATLLWVAIPLLLSRAVVGIVQAQNRSRNAIWPYVFIECLHPIVGFGAGLLIIYYFSASGVGALVGVLCGAGLAAVLCVGPSLKIASRGKFDVELRQRLITFALPLAGTYVVTSILQYADRFLVDIFAGGGALGVYAVAFSLVERPTTLLCMLISTATFPIAVAALEKDGIEAARRQTTRNGVALLALAVPACVGLAFSAHYVSAVLVGPEFREDVARLIPPLALVALIRNAGTHYLDHSFHLLRRSDLMLIIYGPAALVNVGLDVVLIPHFGVLGAVWASFVALSAAMAMSIFFGIRHYGLVLPYREIARIIGATIPMALVLVTFRPPETAVGLAMVIFFGASTYIVSAFALGIGEFRVVSASKARRAILNAFAKFRSRR